MYYNQSKEESEIIRIFHTRAWTFSKKETVLERLYKIKIVFLCKDVKKLCKT